MKRYTDCPMGKVGYETSQGAEFFAEADGMRAYKCNFCEYYHLTSQTKEENNETTTN